MRDAAREIENLIYSYAERIDAGDLVGVGELFEHGRIVAAPDMVVEGAAAVCRLYERTTRIHADGTPRTRHLTTNVIIEVAPDGASATSRSTYTVLQQTEVLPLQPIISGRYRDAFVLAPATGREHDASPGGSDRAESLRWRFASREILVDLTGELGEHLLFEL